jgi:hypothetical protein
LALDCLLLLGAYHGINPGMGWLFAVALGLQEKSRQMVIKSLLPIALGHAISIVAVVLLVGLAESLLPKQLLSLLSAALLFAFGLYLLFRSRHPRWIGMRVGFRDLTVWSFLMASAHGAGLMLVPILLKWPEIENASSHMAHASWLQQLEGSTGLLLAAIGVHTLSMFLVTGLVAIIVYEKLGLALLRKAWFNLDLLWSIALIIAGVTAFIVAPS